MNVKTMFVRLILRSPLCTRTVSVVAALLASFYLVETVMENQ